MDGADQSSQSHMGHPEHVQASGLSHRCKPSLSQASHGELGRGTKPLPSEGTGQYITG